jgi:tRNA(Ile)-lysidine synthetase-like protein
VAVEAVERFETSVRGSLLEYGLAAGSSVLCAFSGGPDSSALALALSRIKDEFGFCLELAYVDHGLRPLHELKAEIAQVRVVGASLGCRIHVLELGRGAVEAYAQSRKCGIEAAARDLRYSALASVLKDSPETFLALGHTFSDQAETMIARFFSGSGIRGLRGMKGYGLREVALEENGEKRRFKIMRPLLGLEKSDVIAYLEAMGRSWSVDSTNGETIYLRNRMRLEMLPRVQKLFPGYLKSLNALRGKLTRIESFLDESAEGLFRKEGGTWRADFIKAIPRSGSMPSRTPWQIWRGESAFPSVLSKNALMREKARKSLSVCP